MDDDSRKWWIAAAAVGGAAIAAGIAYALTRRSSGPSSGPVGRAMPRESDIAVRAGGMTSRSYYKKHLPIEDRVRILQDLVAKSVRDPEMRKLALKITRSCPARDGDCEAKAIYHWTRNNIRYTGDIAPHVLPVKGRPVEAVDLFQTAKRTVEIGGGDCDDMSVLNSTLATLNGITSTFAITAPSRGRGDDWSHIYSMVNLPKTRPAKSIAIDTTLPGNKYGFEAPFGKKKVFPV